MILGIVWHTHIMYELFDESIIRLTNYESIRTLTTERLEQLKKENNLMFDEEYLCYNADSYNEYKKYKKMKIAIDVISDENFDQYEFGMNKSDFIKWCKGE